MATPVNKLSDEELQAAAKKLGKLTGQVQKEANQNPGPGWEPVIDRIEGAWKELEDEVARRSQAPGA